MTVVVARTAAVIVCDNCGATLRRERRVTDLAETSAVDVLERATVAGWNPDAERTDADACAGCSTAARTVPPERLDAPPRPAPSRSGLYLVPRPHTANERTPETLDDQAPASMTARVRCLLDTDDTTDTRPA